VLLSDEGFGEAEQLLEVKDLYDPNDPGRTIFSMRLKQKNCFSDDVNYIVRNGEVVIVDEFTGRCCQDVAGVMDCTRRLKRKNG